MNDFTKEELVMLKRLLLQHVNIFRQNSDCIELMGKVQSMIEKYCEHQYALIDPNVIQCSLCGKGYIIPKCLAL